jgi:hypothetical protein
MTRVTPSSNSGSRQPIRLTPGEVCLLLVPAIWMAFHVPARNPVGIPHLERLIAAGAVFGLASCLAAWLLLRLTDHRRAVINGVFVAGLLVVAAGGLLRQRGSLAGWAIVALVVVIVSVLTIRMDRSVIPNVLVVTLAVFLLAGPVTDAVSSFSSFGTDTVQDSTVQPVQLETEGDVYLIVLDGFPGPETLAADFGADMSALVPMLESRGFEVPGRARAAYPATNYSIPSLLAMGYPSTEEELTNATLQSLYDVISGDNPVVQSFSESGYVTHMIEAGWSGSSCRHWFDRCVTSAWLDDPMYHVLRDSLLTDLFTPVTGSNYPVNSLATMEGVLTESATQSDEKAFVFAHVLAPHPPLMLESDCSVVVEDQRAGYFFPRAGVSDDARSEFLVKQIKCVVHFMSEVVNNVDADDVVIFVADHGTDRRGQLAKEPSSWTEDELMERLNVLVAVRTPMDCPLDDDVHLPNVMRQVLSCLGSASIPDIDERTYLFTKDL